LELQMIAVARRNRGSSGFRCYSALTAGTSLVDLLRSNQNFSVAKAQTSTLLLIYTAETRISCHRLSNFFIDEIAPHHSEHKNAILVHHFQAVLIHQRELHSFHNHAGAGDSGSDESCYRGWRPDL